MKQIKRHRFLNNINLEFYNNMLYVNVVISQFNTNLILM